MKNIKQIGHITLILLLLLAGAVNLYEFKETFSFTLTLTNFLAIFTGVGSLSLAYHFLSYSWKTPTTEKTQQIFSELIGFLVIDVLLAIREPITITIGTTLLCIFIFFLACIVKKEYSETHNHNSNDALE